MARTKGNIRRRPSGRFQVNWIDGEGQRRFKTFGRKKDAEALLRQAQYDADRERAGLSMPAPAIHIWGDLVELWELKKAAKRSLDSDQGRIRKHLTPLLAGRHVHAIGPAEVTRVEVAIAAKIRAGEFGVSTSRKVLVLFNAMLRMAHRERWLAAAPHVTMPAEPRRQFEWLREADQMTRLISAAQDLAYPGLAELYALALYTGMRAGELLCLQWSDVDFDRLLVTVQRSWEGPTKSGRIRHVPLPSPVAQALREWRLRCPHPDLLFPSQWGRRHHKSGPGPTTKYFHRCLAAADLPRIRFHDLRHTFASHYMLNGGEIYRLSRILGHASVTTTMRYAHLDDDAFAGDRERLGDLFPRRFAEGLILSSASR